MIALHECGFPLNPMERAAAEDAEGVIAITGGTGAGKPHTIAALVAHLLDTGTPPGRIVCLTVGSEGSADLRLWLENHHRTRVASQSGRSFTSPHAALLLFKSSET